MLEKIALGIFITMSGSLILYGFRVRQLYVVLPRLFSVSPLTNNGKMVEIRVINKSRVPEEDISIALAPGRCYEIIASTDASPNLKDNAISIPRIPPGEDFSVLLMIEGADFSKNEISTISSKMAKGKILDDLEKVPPNSGNFILGIFSILLVMGIMLFSIDYYNDWSKEKEEMEKSERLASLSFLKENGWASLERYSESSYRQNYKTGEFPIFQEGITRKGNVVFLKFRVINKAAAELSLSIAAEWPFKKDDPKPWEHAIKYSHSVLPGGVYEFPVAMYWPKGKHGKAYMTFHLSSGEDQYIGFTKTINVNI